MKQLYRDYTDVNGIKRTLKYIKRVPWIVNWMKGRYPSRADKWEMEDGSIVQIPKDAWPVLEIKYKDRYE